MSDHIIEIPLPGRTLVSHSSAASARPGGYTLPAFVAGPENRLVATTVCRLLDEAAAAPATGRNRRLPNVLAFFGPSGTGKTHLARGLVRHWQERRGDQSAAYLTAQDFRREFKVAMDTHAVVDFRDHFRSRELLAIDDLHRMPNDDYLQQELRATLDACEENGGTVVVTSLRPASALANMSSDLRSRFAGGLLLQLAPPSAAARACIVRHVATAIESPLSDETVEQLAAGLRGTASEVIGALFELCVDLPCGRTAGADRANRLLAARSARRPRLHEIVALVARHQRLPQVQLKSKTRKQSIVLARAIVVFLARELTDATYDQIGQALGGRDHTTIMHNHQKIERDLDHDLALQDAIGDLRRLLQTR